MTLLEIPIEFARTYNSYDIPYEIKQAFWHYFIYGYSPGGFGTAVLLNDFRAAMGRAHPGLTSENLKSIAGWLNNSVLPSQALDTEENITAWRRLSNAQRREILENYGLCPTVFDVLRKVPGSEVL